MRWKVTSKSAGKLLDAISRWWHVVAASAQVGCHEIGIRYAIQFWHLQIQSFGWKAMPNMCYPSSQLKQRLRWRSCPYHFEYWQQICCARPTRALLVGSSLSWSLIRRERWGRCKCQNTQTFILILIFQGSLAHRNQQFSCWVQRLPNDDDLPIEPLKSHRTMVPFQTAKYYGLSPCHILLNARFLLLRQSAYTAVFNVSYLSFSRMIRMHNIW